MSWCKSKPKPTTSVNNTILKQEPVPNLPPSNLSNNTNGYFANGVNGSTLSQGNSPSALRMPKSKLAYTAQDYDALPLNNQSQFVSTKKVTHFVQDRQDRVENYAQEINRANESKLILPNSLLNYELDAENGVSKTPVINTFDYFSGLNHIFTNQTKNNANSANSYGQQVIRLNSVQMNQPISSKIASDYEAHYNHNPQESRVSNTGNFQMNQPISSKIASDNEANYNHNEGRVSNISGNSYQQPLVANNSNISANQPYPTSNIREPINNYDNNSISGLRRSDIA